MRLYFRIEPPYEWVRCENEKVESFGEVKSLDELPTNERVHDMVAVVPGEFVTIHKLNIPAKSKKQFTAAAPFALEENLVDNVEDLHFVPINWRLGEDVPVAVVDKVKMKTWHKLIKKNGWGVTALVPDYSLLPIHNAARSTVVRTDEEHLLINTEDYYGVALDSEFLMGWLEQVSDKNYGIAINDEDMVRDIIADGSAHDARFWQIGNKMAHWLEHKPSNEVNLMVGEFQSDFHHFEVKQYRLAGSLLALSLFVALLFNIYEVISLGNENKSISERMRQVLIQTFPDMRNISTGKEKFMMQQALIRTQGGKAGAADFQLLVAAVAQTLKSNNASVDSMNYRVGELTFSCTLRDFAAVDRLTNNLNKNSLISAKLKSSAANGNQITARYVISRG